MERRSSRRRRHPLVRGASLRPIVSVSPPAAVLKDGAAVPAPRARVLMMPSWGGVAGLRALLVMALPLIMTSAVHSVNLFLDRVFLAMYSRDAFTAALQSGMMSWTLLILPFMTVSYTATFVSQFIGAKREKEVGHLIGQAVWMALIGGVFMAALAPLAYPFFRWVGHEGNLPKLEADYLWVLATGAVANLLNAALSCYFIGRGRTMLVLFVNVSGCLVNACLNVWLIFTPIWIIPAGMVGAAVATLIGAFVGAVLFAVFIWADPSARSQFGMFARLAPNGHLMWKMLRFGFPSGVHALIDTLGFAVFLLVVGKFGYAAQFASNLAMNLNLLLFIPAVGLHQAVAVAVGNFCGGKDHSSAERVTANAAWLCLVYMLTVTGIYLFIPEPLLLLFRGTMAEAEWQAMLGLAKLLLLVVAFYSTFDAMLLVYSGTLKGAGDTQFVMWVSIIFSQLLLIWPCLILAAKANDFANPNHGLFVAWAFCAAYIVFLAFFNVWRYWRGGWKTIDMVGSQEPNLVED